MKKSVKQTHVKQELGVVYSRLQHWRPGAVVMNLA